MCDINHIVFAFLVIFVFLFVLVIVFILLFLFVFPRLFSYVVFRLSPFHMCDIYHMTTFLPRGFVFVSLSFAYISAEFFMGHSPNEYYSSYIACLLALHSLTNHVPSILYPNFDLFPSVYKCFFCQGRIRHLYVFIVNRYASTSHPAHKSWYGVE
jgi:hypothetical protein